MKHTEKWWVQRDPEYYKFVKKLNLQIGDKIVYHKEGQEISDVVHDVVTDIEDNLEIGYATHFKGKTTAEGDIDWSISVMEIL